MLGLFDWGGLVIVLVISVLIILAIREIVMWYWKINEIKNSLHQQEESLESILKELKNLNDKMK